MVTLDSNLDFVAIDVETANADMASICQIGIAKYDNGILVEEWSSLVDPEDYFDFINIDIHGITEDDVAGKPIFPEVVNILGNFLNGAICVSHTHFDRVSINRALTKYGLTDFDTTWLDSARVARRAWEEVAWGGYGLANVCDKIGYKFKHHDALEDAKASGRVLLAAIEKTGLDVIAWLKRIKQPIDPSNVSSGAAIKRDGNPEGELYGEILVFTGALEIPRREAADLAASIGCTVAAGVTKKTTLLVVGDQDIAKLAGKEKSSKHIKAEQLIKKGQGIRILIESDFKEIVSHAETNKSQ
jgi:DNA polymerase-3 subunit epsilon